MRAPLRRCRCDDREDRIESPSALPRGAYRPHRPFPAAYGATKSQLARIYRDMANDPYRRVVISRSALPQGEQCARR